MRINKEEYKALRENLEDISQKQMPKRKQKESSQEYSERTKYDAYLIVKSQEFLEDLEPVKGISSKIISYLFQQKKIAMDERELTDLKKFIDQKEKYSFPGKIGWKSIEKIITMYISEDTALKETE